MRPTILLCGELALGQAVNLKAISPIDGRYASKTASLGESLSEYALMKYRTIVEIRWLQHLSTCAAVPEVRALSAEEQRFLDTLAANFDESQAVRIKTIERTTNHDVKAVEYFLKEAIAETSLADLSEFLHFGCTSEDINNLAHALMIREAMEKTWLPEAQVLLKTVGELAQTLAQQPMLAHTHGQPASPTTMGKELAVFVYRWQRQIKQMQAQDYLGKFNGAVGAFNAHLAAYPHADWEQIARSFVESFGLTYNPLTTQIESHDWMAELFHSVMRFNNILLDFCRDAWAYISMGYFKQRTIAGEVGSSTMPHKVNPIDFENAEANLGLSNAMLDHLANKLPISRLQRDLSDSSAIRNIGVGIAHSLIALQSALKGVSKLAINPAAMEADLHGAWEVMAEPIQTVLRKAGYPNPYEKLKELTRGQIITEDDIRAFVETLSIDAADKQHLLAMRPETYIGLAATLLKHIEF